MRRECWPSVQIKAAGGVRTLDDLLRVRGLGVARVGATATAAILSEAAARGHSERQTHRLQALENARATGPWRFHCVSVAEGDRR